MALERLVQYPQGTGDLGAEGLRRYGKDHLGGSLGEGVILRTTDRGATGTHRSCSKGPRCLCRTSASTIHRRIYRMAGEENTGPSAMGSLPTRTWAPFVVDEASMIGRSDVSEGAFGGRDLLEDLFQHVFSAQGAKLLLIGDPAQLPPVGSDKSPALDVKELAVLGLIAGSIELTDVVRQASDSGILTNATALRAHASNDPAPAPRFIGGFPDVVRLNGWTYRMRWKRPMERTVRMRCA